MEFEKIADKPAAGKRKRRLNTAADHHPNLWWQSIDERCEQRWIRPGQMKVVDHDRRTGLDLRKVVREQDHDVVLLSARPTERHDRIVADSRPTCRQRSDQTTPEAHRLSIARIAREPCWRLRPVDSPRRQQRRLSEPGRSRDDTQPPRRLIQARDQRRTWHDGPRRTRDPQLGRCDRSARHACFLNVMGPTAQDRADIIGKKCIWTDGP